MCVRVAVLHACWDADSNTAEGRDVQLLSLLSVVLRADHLLRGVLPCVCVCVCVCVCECVT